MRPERTVPPGAVSIPVAGTLEPAFVDPDDVSLIEDRRWRVSDGYAVASLNQGKTLRMHRVIMGLAFGDGLEVDHMNHDRLDNRRVNLRVVTHAQNDQNRPSLQRTSMYRGVSWDKLNHSWRATVRPEGRQITLGHYVAELDAARAAEAARRAHMPFSIPMLELEPLPPCPCKSCSPGVLPGNCWAAGTRRRSEQLFCKRCGGPRSRDSKAVCRACFEGECVDPRDVATDGYW
jgi:hypothetical protein